MTSKISFSKISRENLRHRTAFILVTVFIYLMQLLGFVMQIQNLFVRNDLQPDNIRAAIEELVQPQFTPMLIALILGIGLAFDGFKALHSRSQTDFYGSLPLKRNKEYQLILLNSFIIILIPAVLCSGIEIIILGVIGQLSGIVIGNILLTLVLSLLSFLASWVMAALAIIMTGNVFIGLLGCGVFSCYMPLIVRYLVPSYAGTFFSTYTSSDFFGSMLNYFSPFSLAFCMTSYDDMWNLSENGSYIIGMIVWILAIGCISYILYNRRPSEAAGRAMTFEKANPVIRFLIVVPMALYAGLYLQQMALQSSIIWLFAGILIGAVVFHGIVECIYQFDIRGVFSHRKQLLATIVICFAFTGIFMADVFGYDKWMPSRDQIESMEISFDNINNRTDSYWGQAPDGITGDNIDAALELIKEAAKDTTVYGDDISGNRLTGAVAVEESDDCLITTMTVTYKMKGGKEKKRMYRLDVEKEASLIDRIYTTEDFKNDYYSLYTADRSKITKIEWDNSIEYDTLKLTDKERDEFLDTYLEELTASSSSELLRIGACSEFSVTTGKVYYPYRNGYSSGEADSYYIYPSFKKTIAFLNEHGIHANLLEDCTFSKLDISVSDENYENEVSYTITDPNVIEKYQKEFIMTAYDGYLADFDDHIYINGVINTSTGTKSLDLRVTKEVGEKLLKEAKRK